MSNVNLNPEDLPGLNSLNDQMVGESDESNTIDVTDITSTPAIKKKLTPKLKRQITLGMVVVVVVGVILVMATSKQDSVIGNPGLDAMLTKKVGAPTPLVEPSVVSTPLVVPAAASAIGEATPLDIAGPAIAASHPASAVLATNPAATARVTPVVEAADLAALAALSDMKKRILEAEEELANKTAELTAMKREKREAAKTKITVSAVKPTVIITKEKEHHTISMAEKGIQVLMSDGLIYSSGDDFIEASVGNNFPGYGKLVKVDKDARLFETPNHVYHLKD